MAETKKGGGFHAFEQRVHQIEEDDRKAEQQGKPTQQPPRQAVAQPEKKEAPRK